MIASNPATSTHAIPAIPNLSAAIVDVDSSTSTDGLGLTRAKCFIDKAAAMERDGSVRLVDTDAPAPPVAPHSSAAKKRRRVGSSRVGRGQDDEATSFGSAPAQSESSTDPKRQKLTEAGSVDPEEEGESTADAAPTFAAIEAFDLLEDDNDDYSESDSDSADVDVSDANDKAEEDEDDEEPSEVEEEEQHSTEPSEQHSTEPRDPPPATALDASSLAGRISRDYLRVGWKKQSPVAI